jgi:hypothetical protein
MAKLPEDEAQTAAKAALERVRREQESVLGSSMARAADHFSGRDAIGAAEDGGTDAVELWGRRIGRALSLIGVIVLGYMLGVQLKLW